MNPRKSPFTNISKVKYHLPGSHHRQPSFQNSKNVTRKSSIKSHDRTLVNNTSHNPSYNPSHKLSFEVMGVSDPSSSCHAQEKENFSMFPEGREKQEFLRFVEELKEDKDYQNTVTMFTIMYFYAKKNGGKPPKLLWYSKFY